MENLWHYLRSHYWSHRVYPDYEALRDAAAKSWRAVCLYPEKIRSISRLRIFTSADSFSDPYQFAFSDIQPTPMLGRVAEI